MIPSQIFQNQDHSKLLSQYTCACRCQLDSLKGLYLFHECFGDAIKVLSMLNMLPDNEL